MSGIKTVISVSDERLRNTRAWAHARIGTLSGAEVIVAACDEALQARADNAARKEAGEAKERPFVTDYRL